jgi:hypothetical protein
MASKGKDLNFCDRGEGGRVLARTDRNRRLNENCLHGRAEALDSSGTSGEKHGKEFYSTEKRRDPASTESPALGLILITVPV